MKKTVLEKFAKCYGLTLEQALVMIKIVQEGVIWNTLALMAVVLVVSTMITQGTGWSWQTVLGLVAIATSRTLYFLTVNKLGPEGEEFVAEFRIYKTRFERLFNTILPVAPISDWQFEMLKQRVLHRLAFEIEELVSLPCHDFRGRTRASFKIEEMHSLLSKGFQVDNQREFFDAAKYRLSRWRKQERMLA
ncbi:MAG: hypothetical protein WC250_01020 [Candidatus Paceibacterota bacterium]|jgi:hypothetical protein